MISQPEMKSRFPILKSWVIISISACVASFAVFLLYTNLGHQDDLYDSGVYLESARMMLRGGHLYSTIFDSQPPLWLPLVYGSMRLFGTSFLAGQLLGASMGLIVVATTALIARELSDWPGAWVAAAIVILSPMELQWSRAVSPEVPASAFAVAGMAFAMRYIRSGGRGDLGLASVLITGSVLIKLLGLFTMPALFLAVGLRYWQTFLNRRVRWLPLIADAALVIGTFGAVTLSALYVFGPTRVWHQAVEFHWAARSALNSDAVPQTSTVIAQLFAHDWLLVAALLFAVIGLVSVPEGFVLAGWIGITLAGLLFHRPLFSHHLVVLIPPIAIAAGVGWSPFWRRLLHLVDRARARRDGEGIAAAILAMAVGFSLASGLSAVAALQAVRQVGSVRRITPDSADLKAVQLIVQLTAQDAVILTDAQGIAFAAGRDVPPQLSDTSFVRIASGYLTTSEVILAAEECDVQLFLSWSGRLAMLPGVIEWAERRFPYHTSLGKGRDLYAMRPLIASN
jgi:4-amino-4-deoxy-L-arabinose transferase-like glycosyltransferase